MTYNVHAGVDGYGRANQVIDSAVALTPDILFAQEVWRGENVDQYSELQDRLSLNGIFVELGVGERVTGEKGGRGWQSPWALIVGEDGLYFDERRELTSHQLARRQNALGRESGTWGVALLTTLKIQSLAVEALPQLRRDKVKRELLIARLLDERGREFYAVGLHGSHLTHGSLLQYRHIARRLDVLSSQLPVILGGDFNCWRPLLRVVLRGWRTGVRAKTWPAWRAHSQIDHLLVRGPWSITNAHSVNGPSDHRALVMHAQLT